MSARDYGAGRGGTLQTLRTSLIGLLFTAALAAGGCRTEQTQRTVEVERVGDTTTVKEVETHNDKKGTVKRVEKRTYDD